MSAITIGDIGVLSAFVSMPLMGEWTLDGVLDLGEEKLPTGAFDLEWVPTGETANPVKFRGTVIDASASTGRATVWAVGGTGGLRNALPGLDYGEVRPRLVVEDILSAAGELAGDLSGLDALPKLPRWSRLAGTGRSALTRLCEAIGVTWRVRRDGKVRVGAETWPTHKLPKKERPYFTSEPNASGRAEVAMDSPTLEPGEQLERGEGVSGDPYRVATIVHCADEEGAVRTLVTLQESTGGLSRERELWGRAVRSAVPPAALGYPHRATVIAQDAGGLLDVRLDDVDAPMPTASAVPIYPGMPGAKVWLTKGAGVLVEFAGGREERPFVRSFATGAPFEHVDFDEGTRHIARVGDATENGTIAIVAPPGILGGPCTIAYAPPGGVPSGGLTATLVGRVSAGWPKLRGGV